MYIYIYIDIHTGASRHVRRQRRPLSQRSQGLLQNRVGIQLRDHTRLLFRGESVIFSLWTHDHGILAESQRICETRSPVPYLVSIKVLLHTVTVTVTVMVMVMVTVTVTVTVTITVEFIVVAPCMCVCIYVWQGFVTVTWMAIHIFPL
jgi:hypothetical protein